MPRTAAPVALLVLALAALVSGSAAEAAAPHRLGDLNSGVGTSPSSYPRGWIEAGNRAFFVANHRFLGPEMFATEGTPETTHLLADSSPGSSSRNPVPFGVSGDRLFWWAWTGGRGLLGALWISDGTPDGTRQVLPEGVLIPEPDPVPGSFAFVDGVLHFVGCEEEICALWRSDGTPEGTRSVHPLTGRFGAGEIVRAGEHLVYTTGGDLWALEPDDPGGAALLLEGGDARTPPGGLAAVGSTVFFSFEANLEGDQLWTTDGTAGGTRQISSFPNTSRIAAWRRVVGSGLYFLAEQDFNGGFEIWRSDGTELGTRPVTAFEYPDALDLSLEDRSVAILGQRVFVVAEGDESFTSRSVWVSDGDPGTTRDLLGLVGCSQDCPRLVSPLAVAGGRVVFVLVADGRLQLWSSDGTDAGTGPVADLCEAPCTSNFVGLHEVGREVDRNVGFLTADRVWITDGTAGGTFPIAPPEVRAPSTGGDVGRVNGCWLFPGEDHRGVEPWCSEGPPESARLLADIDRSAASSAPREIVAVGDLAVFAASDETGFRQVWSSDGSPGSARRLTTLQLGGGGDGRGLVSGGDFAVFDQPGIAENLWRTDGTDDGTFPIGALFRNTDVAYRGRVYSFGYVSPADQAGIWEIDGSPEGPRLVVPFPSLAGLASYPTVVDDTMYFLGAGDGELWRTEGTAGTTWKVSTLPADARLSQHLSIAALDGLVYFVVDSQGSTQDQLWRTDGSPDSAERVATIPDFEENASHPGGGLHSHRGALYLAAATFDPNTGTRGGTVFRFTEAEGLTPLVSSDAILFRTPFVSVGEDVLFTFDDGTHGIELWRTDGTPAGTRMVADLHRGGSSYPTGLTAAGDRLFFAATGHREGRELWQMDADGSVGLVADLAPGAFSSEPEGLTVAGGTLYFSADDGETGREPWALPDAVSGAPAPPPGPYLASAEVPGFRFKVRITSPSGMRLAGRQEAACIPETLCVSGALPGRSEVFLRVVGPKPNGFLWPTLVKFSTSRVEVWVEQTSSGQVRYYDLAPAAPGFDGLPGLFDRRGFPRTPRPQATAGARAAAGTVRAAPRPAATPPGARLTSPALPGFDFRVVITDQQGQEQPVRVEPGCIPETVCLSGALPGRSELFLRVVGPKPNGRLWPTLVRFSTSTIDVWITQTATGVERHYRLEGATPGSSDLSGLFDRDGFEP